jgi:hypothetical protein
MLRLKNQAEKDEKALLAKEEEYAAIAVAFTVIRLMWYRMGGIDYRGRQLNLRNIKKIWQIPFNDINK